MQYTVPLEKPAQVADMKSKLLLFKVKWKEEV